MDPTQLPALAGWPGQLATLAIAIIYVWISTRNAKSKMADKANNAANDAYERAIHAMQTHTDILSRRLDDAEKENTKLRRTVEDIHDALEARGIHVIVWDGNTTIHISEKKEGLDT